MAAALIVLAGCETAREHVMPAPTDAAATPTDAPSDTGFDDAPPDARWSRKM